MAKKIKTSFKYFVNDEGDNATIVAESDGKFSVYTDLSATAKKYDSLQDAEHELFVCGYYEREKA